MTYLLTENGQEGGAQSNAVGDYSIGLTHPYHVPMGPILVTF